MELRLDKLQDGGGEPAREGRPVGDGPWPAVGKRLHARKRDHCCYVFTMIWARNHRRKEAGRIAGILLKQPRPRSEGRGVVGMRGSGKPLWSDTISNFPLGHQ